MEYASMAKIALNRPDIAHRPPNFTPEATEFGDTWDTVVKNVNAMMNDLYGSGAQSTAGAFPIVTGATTANIAGQGIISLSTIGDYTLSSPTGPGIFCEIIFASTQGATAPTAAIVLTSSAAFDGVNFVSRSTASSSGTSPKKSLSLISLSTSTWQILANQGLTPSFGYSTGILLGLATV
jgi:hypothetical protein